MEGAKPFEVGAVGGKGDALPNHLHDVGALLHRLGDVARRGHFFYYIPVTGPAPVAPAARWAPGKRGLHGPLANNLRQPHFL